MRLDVLRQMCEDLLATKDTHDDFAGRAGMADAFAVIIPELLDERERLVAALAAFVRMDDKREEITGGEWCAAVVMARAAIGEAPPCSG